MEVEARPAAVRFATHLGRAPGMEEPARGVRLVRRLVAREANIAVQAEHGAFRVAQELGREAREADVHLLNQIRHWLLDVPLVILAMCLEPRLRVVLRQPAEESESLRVEVFHGILDGGGYAGG